MLVYDESADIKEEDAKDFAENRTSIIKYSGDKSGIRDYCGLNSNNPNDFSGLKWLVNFTQAGITDEQFAEGLKKGYLKVKDLRSIYLI